MTVETVPSPVAIKPPRIQVGPIAWLRDNLFSSIGNSVLTILGLAFLYFVLQGFINFAIIHATWTGEDGTACAPNDGACWPFVFAKFSQFMFGNYPLEERWRPKLVYLLAIGGLVPLMFNGWGEKRPFLIGFVAALGGLIVLRYIVPVLAGFNGLSEVVDPVFLILAAAVAVGVAFVDDRVSKTWFVVFFFAIFPFLAFFLLVGGILGLKFVATEFWGGMMLTLVVATIGIVAAFPIGICLALGRRSKMPIIKAASVGFIEFVRGVPLITVLFMSSVMLPLFLPPGWNIDKLLRALIMVALFSAAYLAETIRGGLQAIPRGQFEAADALGLSYRQKVSLIILPQALKLVIPGIVNSFIGLFKDTSLVLIIGLFDLLGIVQKNMADQKWFAPTTSMTGYLFAGLLFWLFCFGMSRYSAIVERNMAAGDKR